MPEPSKQKPSTSLSTMLQAALPEVKNSLPVSADQSRLEQIAKRFNRIAMTAVRMNDDLQVCDFKSIVGCVIQGASLGLELNGVMGQAYMIPYNNKDKGIIEAQFQLGYQGMVDLIYRHPKVSVAYAEVVREDDEFKYNFGTKPSILHIPGDYKEVITHAYAVIGLTTGPVIICVWTTQQINEHLRHFSQAYRAGKGPAMDPLSWPTMAKKTVFLQASKWAPKSIETQRIIESEDVRPEKKEVISDEDIESTDEFDITEEERLGKIQDAEFEDEGDSKKDSEKEMPSSEEKGKSFTGEEAPEKPQNSKKSKNKLEMTKELLDLVAHQKELGNISEGEHQGVVNWIDEYRPTAIEIRKKIQDWEEALSRRGVDISQGGFAS